MFQGLFKPIFKYSKTKKLHFENGTKYTYSCIIEN